MAGTLTPTGDDLALDFLFDTIAVTRPTAWYVALHVGPNNNGTTNEIVGNGYARQAMTYTRSGNVVTNSTLATFGPCTGSAWGTVTDVTVWDSLTAGRCLGQGTATASVTYNVGDSATLAIAAQQITLT